MHLDDLLSFQEYLIMFLTHYHINVSLYASHPNYGTMCYASNKINKKRLTSFSMDYHYLMSSSFMSFQTHS